MRCEVDPVLGGALGGAIAHEAISCGSWRPPPFPHVSWERNDLFRRFALHFYGCVTVCEGYLYTRQSHSASLSSLTTSK